MSRACRPPGRGRLLASSGLLALVAGGCASMGPATLPRDRLDYSSAIADSWKHQTLLNIVKLRYMDPPVFLDVAQVVSGYQLQTTLQAGGTASVDPSTVPTIGSFLSLGAQGSYTDRPTITYAPLTGDQYVRGIMTPLRPEQVFSAILAGFPADAILVTSLVSINGLANQRSGGLAPHPGDPEFFRVVQLLRRLQDSGALRFRIKGGRDQEIRNLLFFGKAHLSDEERQQILETRQLLGLHPTEQEFALVFGPAAASDREIAVQTRSLLQILIEVGGQVNVPAVHLSEGRATPGLARTPDAREPVRLMTIHSSKERVADAFLSVRYREHWFWIDDRDLAAKRNFAFLMFLFALADTGEKKAAPLITIPAQ